MPTLISYNTSYVTDCHSSQFNLFMSESSSILKKAIEVYNSTHPETKIDLKYASESDPKLKTDIYRLKSDQKNIGENLDVLRKNMAETSTRYLEKFINSQRPEFIALIEQSIHVGNQNHAYYDAFVNNKFNLESLNPPDLNQNYGILKRKNALKFDDLDEDKQMTDSEYFIVYDNVVNKTAKNAEGISIAFRKDLFDVQLKWDPRVHPSRQELLTDAEPAKTLIPKVVSYFSGDLGPIVCYDPKSKKIRYATGRDDPNNIPIIDAGRPIIMTGGISTATNTLKLLVAIHGPNIPNLFPVANNIRGPKSLKELLDSPGERENAFKMFGQVRKSIGDFIESGLDNIQEEAKLKITEDTKVEIYLGGDLNDPRGIILESFINDGINLTLPIASKKTINVSFKRYKLKPNPARISNKDVSQFRYENLRTCCANADSITAEAGRNLSGANGLFDEAHLFKLSKYPPEFHDPKNFGYNGDYALYGSSYKIEFGFEEMETGLSAIYASELVWKGNPELVWEGIYASDHLPVISKSGIRVGGKITKRRNRKNKKSLKRRKNKN